MDAMSYQQQSLVGATGVELIVALYDAALKSLFRAKQCVEDRDTVGRRVAVKKVVDIIMYLQARLRPDLGQAAAATLSDFYAVTFAMTLEASLMESAEQLGEVIANVRSVRDAWAIAAKDPEVARMLPRELRSREERYEVPASQPVLAAGAADSGEVAASRWSA